MPVYRRSPLAHILCKTSHVEEGSDLSKLNGNELLDPYQLWLETSRQKSGGWLLCQTPRNSGSPVFLHVYCWRSACWYCASLCEEMTRVAVLGQRRAINSSVMSFPYDIPMIIMDLTSTVSTDPCYSALIHRILKMSCHWQCEIDYVAWS